MCLRYEVGLTNRTAKENKRIHELEKARDIMPTKSRKAPSPELSDVSDYDFDSDLEMSDASGSGQGASEDEEDDGEDAEDDSGSDFSDQDEFNEAYENFSSEDDEEDEQAAKVFAERKRKKKEAAGEAEYETSGRSRWVVPEKKEEDTVEVGRLPIKLPTGEVKLVEGTTRVALPPSKKPKPVPESESEESEEEEEEDAGIQAQHMAHKPGRFGRMGIAEIVSSPGMKKAQRLDAAKEQLAAIGAEILAGGELVDIGPVLTRMSTFALPTVPAPSDGQAITVPYSIRALALLSQLAVYKDITPGYRIRQLTAAEEAERVRDEVRRLREGEKMLVRNYKAYLKSLEGEIKKKTPLQSVALRCMCELLAAIPHFNYSENIMGVVVGRIGRRSWDDDSELILDTLVQVFLADVGATYSQALVRLIARMIKERKFQVHQNVLSCLLHLRLRTELGHMRDGKKKPRGKFQKRDDKQPEKKYKSEIRKKWQTKNQRKKEKEMKEIDKEMAEAAAEVDEEERAQIQTETLKNLFVLYFSILKFPGRSPLLPAALEGISHFAQLINVDFFRDLLQVLRKIISDRRTDDSEDAEAETAEIDPVGAGQRVRIRMLGIVTAFDLLSGQGEAINVDLSDFVTELFALLRPLSLDTGIEDPPNLSAAAAATAAKQYRAGGTRATADRQPAHTLSTAALLFRCLESIFFPRMFARTAAAPPLRAAAFAKRMCECALTFPPNTAKEALSFVRRLAAKEPKLANLLDTEERMFDGVYRPEMDDPQLTNPFTTSLYELDVLAQKHWEHKVRGEAKRLRDAQFA